MWAGFALFILSVLWAKPRSSPPSAIVGLEAFLHRYGQTVRIAEGTTLAAAFDDSDLVRAEEVRRAEALLRGEDAWRLGWRKGRRTFTYSSTTSRRMREPWDLWSGSQALPIRIELAMDPKPVTDWRKPRAPFLEIKTENLELSSHEFRHQPP